MKTLANFIWYNILDKLIKPGKKVLNNPVLGELDKMVSQVKFYLYFDMRIVWLGDSNVQKGSKFDIMNKFKLLTVNLGRGGSYCHHWLVAFITNSGKRLYNLINKKIVILNLGGNYILKGQMDIALDGLYKMKKLFPVSFMVNVPPIHADIFAALVKNIPDFPYKTAEEVNKQVDILNGYIRQVSGKTTIDIHKILDKGDDIKLWWFALADIVHYNDDAYKHLYVKLINAIITILQKAGLIK